MDRKHFKYILWSLEGNVAIPLPNTIPYTIVQSSRNQKLFLFILSIVARNSLTLARINNIYISHECHLYVWDLLQLYTRKSTY